ncbi:DUF4340 domain-containing protein [Tuwongella immobilis]|uniref:DUF4340 domain-containing protein n=1 Tax=Tuwongella immobilis TaxID=692036 RepID=A0A6C2YR45_9BACT|nr:DUF4340 domain-containing protein [Tuwongella immobilis]VIP03811.1 Uncharacterized protein OS=Chthoniobacter flavus Ellin428 GN=CfE428DRAFT_2297 PE=4 SV=1: DUF4340: DUF4340: DUF4340 [Tuwongella immobilis]VTS04989.1 Uncharacterized protein OS=Chthoniobacter flavus Ellin428 GN=CfE428DRAFT_2297 PE=4 SV=1: DUF4340: DUF4340: DUF4340 [Tuwongella immobilis]
MNLKTTYVMFGILGVGLIGVLGLLLTSTPDNPTEKALLPAFAAAKVEPKDIDTVEISTTLPDKGTTKLVFLRKDPTRWVMTEPQPTRVDSTLIDDVVRELLRARTEDTKDISTNLANHGLDKPTVTVTLKSGLDQQATVSLGHVSIGGANALVFVTSNDVPTRPRAVRRTSIDALFTRAEGKPEPDGLDAALFVRKAADFRALKLFDLQMPTGAEEATQVRLQSASGELLLTKADRIWSFEKPANLGEADADGGPPTVDNSITGVRPLLGQITSLSAKSVADFITEPKPLGDYGLEDGNPNLLKLSVTRKPIPLAGSEKELPAITETVKIGDSVDGKNDRFYAQVEGDSSVVQITGGPAILALRKVASAPNQLRDKVLAKLVPANVDAIQTITPAQTLEFFRRGTPPAWTLWDATSTADAITPAAVERILTELIEPRKISNFPATGQTDAALGLDKPVAELNVWVKALPAEEPKKDGEKPTKPTLPQPPTFRLLFGRVEGDFVYVRRILAGSTQPLDAIVPVSLLRTVSRPRVDYLDPKLNGFEITQVESLKISGKTVDNRIVGATISTENKEAKTPDQVTWKLDQVNAAKGRNADPAKVTNLILGLANLTPVKLVQDRPSADALSGYGLAKDAALLTVEVTLRGDASGKTRVYHFGQAAKDDPTNVYGQQQGRDLVFLVNQSLISQLTDPNLMDMTLFRVEKSKIKSFVLRGWADLVGSVQSREFERSGDSWTLKGDSGYAIDPKKIDSFLEDLSRPRAEAFLVYGSGAKPEHGLDVKTGALEIELRLDTPDPVILTLGKADTYQPQQGNGAPVAVYVGSSNKLPGDVFVILQDRFQSVRQKPKVFAKE